MKDKIFVDSNIWIYLFASDEKSKNEHARKLIADSTAKGNIIVVSYQVINEICAVLKRKKQFDESKIQFVVETMFDLCIVQNFSREILLRASVLRNTMSLSYWDSLIVASAIESDCKYLTSEDMQNGQKIDGVTIINIFQ